MDFGGVVSLEGLPGAASSDCSNSLLSSSLASSNNEPGFERGFLASSFYKHGRSCAESEEEYAGWRAHKVPRTGATMATASTRAAPFLLGSNSRSFFSDGEQMLSFSSSPKQDSLMLSGDGATPYYNQGSSYLGNAGLPAGIPSLNMSAVLARVRGPFTPSQWLELEHQALIYKYFVAKIPIPASLLIPIRRGLSTSVFTSLAGSYGSSTLGWGTFHLGYSGNADPEPGRCRRTDGKKWRCSRDAVADQKYCERHINRGRHRSRKHVEGRNGHAAKAMPAIATSQSTTTVSGGGSSANLNIEQQQAKSLQPNVEVSSPTQLSRIQTTKGNINDHSRDYESQAMLTSTNLKTTSTLFPVAKQHNPFEPNSANDGLGLIGTGSFLSRDHHSSNHISFVSDPTVSHIHAQSNPFRHFIDDWPKIQSDSWHEGEEMQCDRTQLSISMPVGSSDFSSSSSHEKLILSPLRLSREYDPAHMGLGVGIPNEGSRRQTSWNPITWEASMAGPLGEVLTNTSNPTKDQSRNCSSSLNLLTNGWDSSPRLESSPTGVLQKTSFDSLSSSTRSSPRTENHKVHESTGNLCDDVLGSTFANPLAIPSL